MIAALSSFDSQFDPALVKEAHNLFDNGAIKAFKLDNLTWNTEVTGVKDFKVSVRVDEEYVTDVYCTCRSGICAHIIAVMFALRKKLKVKKEAFRPEILEPDPIFLVGPRINDLVYISRQAGSKNGELEQLGTSVSLKNPDFLKFKSMAGKGLTGYDNSPIYNGAKRLLGAAILAIEDEKYSTAFMIARAILAELSPMDSLSNSATECCRASVAIISEIYNLPSPSARLKEEIFTWTMSALGDEVYAHFAEDIILILSRTLQKNRHQLAALEKLQSLTAYSRAKRAICDAEIHLLKLLGKNEESVAVRYKHLDVYGKELVAEAFAIRNYEEVKRLARTGIQEWHPGDWWEWLYKIAKLENDLPTTRDYYRYRYFNTGLNHQHYQSARDSYETAEWKEIYPSWMQVLEDNRAISEIEIYALARIYVTEGLAEKMALHVKRFPRYDLAVMGQSMLEKKVPDLLKKILSDHFIMMSRNSSTRDRTAELRLQMKTCRRTLWGKQLVKELIPQLLELHPTWKVFREELSRPF